MVLEKESEALRAIQPILRDRRDVILKRINNDETALREAFEELEVLDYRRSFEECIALTKRALGQLS